MRYPCSFMIYSPGFEGLPAEVKAAVSARIGAIFAGKDQRAKFRTSRRPTASAHRRNPARHQPGRGTSFFVIQAENHQIRCKIQVGKPYRFRDDCMSRIKSGTTALLGHGRALPRRCGHQSDRTAQNAPAKPSPVPAPVTAAAPHACRTAGNRSNSNACGQTSRCGGARLGESHNAVVKRYCVTCHSERRKTWRPFARGASTSRRRPSTPTSREKMIVKLQAGMMPPPGARRPEPAVHMALINALETTIDTRRPRPTRIRVCARSSA